MGCTRRCSQPEVVVTENYAPKLGRQGGSRVNSLLKNRNNIENKKNLPLLRLQQSLYENN